MGPPGLPPPGMMPPGLMAPDGPTPIAVIPPPGGPPMGGMPPGMGPPGMPPMGMGPPPMPPMPGMMPPMGPPGMPPPGIGMPDPSMGMPMPMGPPPPMPGMEPIDAGPFEDPVAIATIIANTTDDDLPAMLDALIKNSGTEAIPALVNLLASFPAAQERILNALTPEEDDEPEDPYWYDPSDYPKPTWGDVDTWVSRAESYWRRLRQDMGEWEEIFFQRKSGLFNINQDDPDFERFYSSAIRADTKLAIDHAASAEIVLDVTPMAGGGKEEAQRVEDAWHHYRAVEEQRHSMRGNSNLQYDEAFITAVRGRIVARQTVVTEDRECPLFYALMDPAAVYPSWDRYGISAVAHVYQTTLGEARTAFKDPKGKVSAALKDSGPDGKRVTGQFDQVTVVEWWDRRWHGAKLKDGRVLLEPVEHGLCEVPWIYTIADTGRPATLGKADAQVRTPDGETAATTSEEEKQRDVGLPLFHPQIKHQTQLEALMSKNMKLAESVDRPAVQIEQDEVAKAGNPDPEISFESGAVNRTMKDNERLNPVVLQPPAGVLQPVMGTLAADGQRVYQPAASYGASGGVSTGNAMEGQVEAGRDKEIALIKTLERHYATAAALAFRQLLRRGREAGGRDGSRGEFRIPVSKARRRSPDEPTTFVLTPRTIKKASPMVKARMNHVELRNLPAFANTLTIWKQNRLPMRPLLELAGFANAHELMREGMEEELKYGADTTPFQRFATLLEETKNADGTYDWLRAVALWQIVGGNVPQQGGQPPPGGPPPMPGMGGGGGGLPVNTTAMNLAPQNFPQAGVGLGAGRPVSSGAGLGVGGPPGLPPGF